MGGMRFDSLERVPEPLLYTAFRSAFSDYSVPLDLSLEDFRAMHRRRGVSCEESLGAFEGEELVGFIFNGVGTWGGRRCAYDAGTAVLPSHRGRGLSGALAEEASRRLAARGFQSWLLEVLVSNEKAIRTYSGAGFKITRRLCVREGKVEGASGRAAAAAATAGVEIVGRASLEPGRRAAFRDWEPSWQNSDDSIARSPVAPLVLEARGVAGAAGAAGPPGESLGCLVSTEAGSIYQLAVAPGARRRGIGRALLLALAARIPSGSLRYVNVQSDDAATLGLLATLGIGGDLDQWEMAREL